MTVQLCPYHRVVMEIVPAEPRSRCPNCGYMTHHLQFEHCRQCGHRMQIEEPEPHWHCPLCVPAGKTGNEEVPALRHGNTGEVSEAIEETLAHGG
jgi:ribosomal protein S27AE